MTNLDNVTDFGHSEGIHQKLVEVDPGVFQGSRGPAFSVDILAQFSITNVLSITSVTIPPVKGICRWWLCVDDGNEWTHQQIDFVRNFCTFNQSKRNSVLIHCDHGSSRSTGGMIIWQMIDKNFTKEDAYSYIKSRNQFANCREEILRSIPDIFS